MCDPGGDQYSIFRIMDTSVVKTPLDNSHPLPVTIPSYSSHSFHAERKPPSEISMTKSDTLSGINRRAEESRYKNIILQRVPVILQHRTRHQYYPITHTQVNMSQSSRVNTSFYKTLDKCSSSKISTDISSPSTATMTSATSHTTNPSITAPHSTMITSSIQSRLRITFRLRVHSVQRAINECTPNWILSHTL